MAGAPWDAQCRQRRPWPGTFVLVSLHYEWTLSLRFRRDVPEPFLDELRSDFGIGAPLPGYHGADLPGGPVASLTRQQLSASTWLWGSTCGCSSSMT
jgi:hypothetical protein